jgi:hypothetical protein
VERLGFALNLIVAAGIELEADAFMHLERRVCCGRIHQLGLGTAR